MKYIKQIATTSLAALVIATAVPATAAIEVETETKEAGVVFGSAITGAVAGGPLGAMAGMLVGAWLGTKVEAADRVDTLQGQVSQAQQRIATLSSELASANAMSDKMAQIALDQLQLELLFKTGEGELTASGAERLAYLADFLVDNATVNIRLDGYADPRGDDAYNQNLSEQRVESVVSWLTSKGVERQRISAFSHGASASSATVGDYDSYAMERVVKIQLTRGDSNVAQVTLSQ